MVLIHHPDLERERTVHQGLASALCRHGWVEGPLPDPEPEPDPEPYPEPVPDDVWTPDL